MESLVAIVVASLDESLHESFAERAAIIEYEGHYSRQDAEYLALLDLFKFHPSILIKVTAAK
jgi:hypothetical protein